MLTIGEFARHGRVSVRMLRHDDAIGLLRPACVDPASGYRSHEASQLADLNRAIALKELGFTLGQVRAILDDNVSAAELRGMLKLRRAEIEAQIEADTTRLARIEARLRSIEDADRAPPDDVVVKRVAPIRVAELTGIASGYNPDAITPVMQPLYSDLWRRLRDAGVCATGPAVAYYEDAAGEDGAIVVHAAAPVDDVDTGHADGGRGLTLVDLAEIETAAAMIHRGSMDGVLATDQALARWIDANGYRSDGYAREVTLSWSAERDEWVTEPQQPVHAIGG